MFDNVRTACNMHLRHGISHALLRGARFRTRGERDRGAASSNCWRSSAWPPSATTPCTSLPYGDQRRLEIVRALATRPKLLLLDEPAAGMNPTEKDELMKLIRFTQEKFGLAVLLVEHDMKVVMGICSASPCSITARRSPKAPPDGDPRRSQGDRGVPGKGGGRCLKSEISKSATARSARSRASR